MYRTNCHITRNIRETRTRSVPFQINFRIIDLGVKLNHCECVSLLLVFLEVVDIFRAELVHGHLLVWPIWLHRQSSYCFWTDQRAQKKPFGRRMSYCQNKWRDTGLNCSICQHFCLMGVISHVCASPHCSLDIRLMLHSCHSGRKGQKEKPSNLGAFLHYSKMATLCCCVAAATAETHT